MSIPFSPIELELEGLTFLIANREIADDLIDAYQCIIDTWVTPTERIELTLGQDYTIRPIPIFTDIQTLLNILISKRMQKIPNEAF